MYQPSPSKEIVELHSANEDGVSQPKPSGQVQEQDDRAIQMEHSPFPIIEEEHDGRGLGETSIVSIQRSCCSTIDNFSHAEIHLRARKDGLQNTLKSLFFLGKLTIPMLVMATLMFAIFSFLSWIIPHVLCESFGQDLSVRLIFEGVCRHEKMSDVAGFCAGFLNRDV